MIERLDCFVSRIIIIEYAKILIHAVSKLYCFMIKYRKTSERNSERNRERNRERNNERNIRQKKEENISYIVECKGVNE